MAFGDIRNYRKIHIHINGKYECTSTWSRTLAEAKARRFEAGGVPIAAIRATFAETKEAARAAGRRA